MRGETMSQDSDGVAEAVRGGAQIGLTLAAQAVEIAARQRQAARLEHAQADQDAAAHHRDRLSTLQVREQMAQNQRDYAGANEPVAEIRDSRQRRSALEQQLEATAGKEAAAARAVADASQAQPAAKVVAMAPPSPAVTVSRRARTTSPQRAPGAER